VRGQLNDSEALTVDDNELLMSWMDRCNCRVTIKENTRQLISQTILINYVFNNRIVQIEAISVSYTSLETGSRICMTADSDIYM